MSNILNAIERLANNPILEVGKFYLGRNRINNVGDGLEAYIKDLFADSVSDDNETRQRKIADTFSYIGNSSNPPDLILKGGDAIEIKKIESISSGLALNSSYPKSKLSANSPMLTDACRNCETWTEKDMWYIVGIVDKQNTLKSLCMVYGSDYAASSEFYENVISGLAGVDPLEITNMRICRMEGIENPLNVFSYVYKPKADLNFEFVTLVNTDKYNSFPTEHRNMIENIKCRNFSISDVLIKTPDNPQVYRNAKLINFSIPAKKTA